MINHCVSSEKPKIYVQNKKKKHTRNYTIVKSEAGLGRYWTAPKEHENYKLQICIQPKMKFRDSRYYLTEIHS